jgi:hypothetical protein
VTSAAKRPIKPLTVLGLLWVFALGLPGGNALAQTNDFGVGGVLDVPSARSPDEDTFSVTISRRDVADIYGISYQVLPRLEASFRYTIFNARLKSKIPGVKCAANVFDICDGLRDRSFEVKLQLLEESDLLPEVQVGIRDLLGTGAWGGEYVVANKQFGNLDVSAGIGWGRLAERSVTKNPMRYISDRFSNREGFTGLGGEFSVKSYFRGPDIGAFGSVRYSLPQWRVDLLAAYNSDSYARERALGTFDSADPLSVGIEWEATPGVRLTASWQQGNNLALKLSAALDTGAEAPRKPPNGFGATDNLAAINNRDKTFGWFPRMAGDAEASGVLLRALREEGDGILRMRYSNMTYQMEADAIRRIMDLVELYAPRTVHTVELTGDSLALPTHTVRIARSARNRALYELMPPTITIDRPVEIERPTQLRKFKYPNADYSAGIDLRTYLFDPDSPLLVRPSINVRGAVDFGGGWGLDGEWVQSLSNQFDRIKRDGNSQLPPVRTDLKRYLQEGDSGIERLAIVQRGKLGRDLYYQAFGGILEEMYSGVGAEVLWRRADLPFAVGVNVIAVQQREFDKMFGLRDYKTVIGHVSGYWATGFHNFDLAVHAGRYLAKDIGATFEIQKRFANGWSVGAFATLTDVPFEVFGEGSFDKGLIFRVPLDSYTRRNSRGAFRTILRSINRDGGRMIENWSGQLWESMRPTHGDMLENSRDRMVPDND